MAGALVTVSSEQLIGTSRTVETDGGGAWRMAGLPPGLYLVVFTLDGMKPVMRNATLDPGAVLTLNAVFQPGPDTEVVAVIGDGPLIEGRNPAADAYIRDDLLAVIPVEQRFGPEVVGLTPGVDGRTLAAYGTPGPGAQAWRVDGAGIDDPRDGGPAVAVAHAWLAGLRVTGLGAEADAGAFTGVAVDHPLRAGSNTARATAALSVEDGWLAADGLPDAVAEANPGLSPPSLDHAVDIEMQAGGPVQRDRLWLFGGFQVSHSGRTPAGFDSLAPAETGAGTAPERASLSSPRLLARPTLRLGPTATLTGSFVTESLDRDGVGAGPGTAPEATRALDSSAQLWTVGYTRTLAPMSLLEVRYSGLGADRSLSPYNGDTPARFDPLRDDASANAGDALDIDTGRQTLSAAVTLFRALGGGEHDLTFGGEVIAGRAETIRTMPGGATIFTASGLPLFELTWAGASSDARARTTSLFAEDRWVLTPRVTLTPGLRLDLHRGQADAGGDTVYSTSPWSPRIGVAWDVAGDSRTVVRADVGVRHDALRTTFFDRAGGSYAPTYRRILIPGPTAVGPEVLIDPGGTGTVAEDIRQPRVREALAGAEHELLPGVFLSAHVIWRTFDQFVDDVRTVPLAGYQASVETDVGPDGVPRSGDETDQALTVYLQRPPYESNAYRLDNPSGAERRYRGFQLAGRKRLTSGWQVQGAWVVSRLTGNYEPAVDGGVTEAFDDPNRDPSLQPLLEGRLAADRTHLISAMGSYTLPYGVLASGAWRYASGAPYARTVFRFLPTGPADLFIEPRGSRRGDPTSRVDVRFARLFDVPQGDLAVTIEGFNLTGSTPVLWQVSRSGPAFGEPRALAAPRAFRLGASWRF